MLDIVQSSTLLQSTLSRVLLGQRLIKVFKQRSTSPQADLLLSLAYSLSWQQSSSLVQMKVLQSRPGDPISESTPSTERERGVHSKGKMLSKKEISSLVKESRSVVTAHRQLTSSSTISYSSNRELISLASQSLAAVVSLQTSTTTLMFYCLRWLLILLASLAYSSVVSEVLTAGRQQQRRALRVASLANVCVSRKTAIKIREVFIYLFIQCQDPKQYVTGKNGILQKRGRSHSNIKPLKEEFNLPIQKQPPNKQANTLNMLPSIHQFPVNGEASSSYDDRISN